MEPEQERLSKLYSGSGIHSLPELNLNLIQINILRNPVLIHRIHFPLNQRRQVIHHLFRHIISRIIDIIRRHTLDRIGNVASLCAVC